jgi:rhodanese-related sulfurtransferase
MSAQRLDPGEARRDVDSGDALLVCAYDDEEKCQNYALPNALLLSELSAKEKTLPKDREIIFYCA